MKKTTVLLLFAFIAMFGVKAQLPNNWTDDTGIEIFQESSEVHAGAFSCGVVVNTDTQSNCDFTNEVSIPVNSGDSYTVSFWAYTSAGVRITAALDWDTGSEYPGTYVGPGTSGWEEYIQEGTVPDGATTLNIRIRFYDVSGFEPGEVQYVDDVTFESPTGNQLTVTNGDFETWPGFAPEPSNYPEEFEANAAGLSAVLSWIDPAGGQLPENYLIKASIQDNITNPEDGSYLPDDFDLSDGAGAANVAYGEEGFTFSGLNPQTNYYFKIYPYTNSGVNVNYKNDGTPPSAMVEIAQIVIIEEEDFDMSFGNWTPVSVTGDAVWDRDNSYGVNGTPCAQITGYESGSGTTFENEDWLISPAMDFSEYENEILTFYSAVGYITEDEQFAARISTDYDGSGNPNDFTWTDLDPTLPDGGSNWVWTYSGELDISGFNGENVYVAFVYFCGTDDAATWEVDEIMITGEGEVVVYPEPTNYPMDFAATASGTTINLAWTDATGETVPTGYLVLGSDEDNIALPEDAMPVADDATLSDGSGALNISAGVQSASFSGLTAGMTYYFKIFPYTNSGNLIDFKTDGTPPSAEATTETPTEILFTDFNDSWGGWTPVSLVGDQTWGRDNTYGLEGTPCALMSGYSGEYIENEDWLISPALNLSGTSNETVSFYSATNYNGPALEFKISTDYNGTGNPNDFTWTDLSGFVNWSPGSFAWTESGDIDLSAYTENTIYLAYIYYSSSQEAANWEIDNVLVTETEAMPEPTAYPTNFAVEAMQQSVMTSWTDATGGTVPEGYLVLLSDMDNITLPTDGTPVADDTDLSDGMGAKNIMPGEEMFTFTSLMENTTYYATVVPYTNSGSLINYKTDGTPPSGSATTQEAAPEIFYTTFDMGWENWTPVSVVGDQVWDRDNNFGVEGTPCARMSGFDGEALDNEDWLISPPINLTATNNESMSFFSAVGYSGPALQFLISSDYEGTGDPGSFTWDNLTDLAIWPAGEPFWDWTESGSIDLSAYTNETIYVAFAYTSNTGGAATWEVDNIKVMGEGEVQPEPTNYPTNYAVSASQLSIMTSWTDATGAVIPHGYVVMISDTDDIDLPVDGTPTADDTDLSDGMGTKNVMPGAETYTFTDLMENTTYHTVIVPYTNSGSMIDYKTDGIPPGGSATTGEAAPEILFTTFDTDWENWTPVSALGDQVWDRDNTFGVGGTPCASMSGYDDGSFENEDWLISPPIDLTQTNNESMSFMSAVGYSGPALQFWISSDYDGSGDPASFTWDDLTDQAIWPSGDPFWEWTESGTIDLSAYTNETIYIAFVYTSTTSGAATWEVDNIKINGEGIGIPENLPSVNLNIWPNPANDVLFLQAEETIKAVEIYNVTGALVLSQNIGDKSGKLQLSNLEKGIYFARIVTAENKVLSRRIVVQ